VGTELEANILNIHANLGWTGSSTGNLKLPVSQQLGDQRTYTIPPNKDISKKIFPSHPISNSNYGFSQIKAPCTLHFLGNFGGRR
jgi:hypothetical protein